MERLVLVHGSVAGAAATWAPQEALAGRYELVAVERPGFPPGPPIGRVDFEADAGLVRELLRAGDHLVGHSYGGVIAMLAAAGRPEVIRSLTVLEPPATRVALGQPDADRFAEEARTWWETGPTRDPEAFLRGFLRAVGSEWDPPSPLPPDLEQGARMLVVERGAWEADIPLDALRAGGFPTLVVSGAHHAGFDAICDALENELGAERAVLPGVGHTIPRHPDFNRVLADFVDRAAAAGSARAARSGHA